MVLFWHGHFATSIEKCAGTPNSSYLMWRQNELFRQLATDNWLRLLIESGKDPAMLVWLDQWQSRKDIRMKITRAKSWNCFRSAKAIISEHDITESGARVDGLVLQSAGAAICSAPAFHDNGMKTVSVSREILTARTFWRKSSSSRSPQNSSRRNFGIFFADKCPRRN